MGKIAILAEKPSQARAYADAFKVKQKRKPLLNWNLVLLFLMVQLLPGRLVILLN